MNQLSATFYLAVVVCCFEEQVLPYIEQPNHFNFVTLEYIITHINTFGVYFLEIDKFRNHLTDYRKIMRKRFGWQYDDQEKRSNRYYIKAVSIPNDLNYTKIIKEVRNIINMDIDAILLLKGVAIEEEKEEDTTTVQFMPEIL